MNKKIHSITLKPDRFDNAFCPTFTANVELLTSAQPNELQAIYINHYPKEAVMETKIRLNPGETLKHIGHRSKGSLAETDIYSYAIINEASIEIGSVEYTDHTSVNGLRRSQHVIQKDSTGNVIVEARW